MAVDNVHSAYQLAKPLWRKCRDAVAGEEAIKAAGEAYLPKLSGQQQADYDAYKMRALYYNASRRTVDGMRGLVFRKSPMLSFPTQMEGWGDDIDLAGQNIFSLAETLIEEVLVTGRCGILVDHPPAQDGVVTRARAEASAQRPYLRLFAAEDIVNWRLGVRKGRTVPVQIVLAETITIDGEDEFSLTTINQRRVLDFDPETGGYRQRVFQNRDGVWDLVEQTIPRQSGQMMDTLPFVFFSPGGMDADIVRPPLLDLVNVNLSHYRTSADYEHGAHYTGLPTPVITGAEPEGALRVGAGEAWVLPNEGANAFYLEFSGSGLGALEQMLDRKEGQMAALGARMLAPEKKMPETAEAAAIRRGGENAVLASIANACSEGLSQALRWMAKWGGIAGDPSISLNTDYLPAPMDAAELTAWLAAVQAGEISRETFFEALKMGEAVCPDLTYEEEALRREADGPALGEMGSA